MFFNQFRVVLGELTTSSKFRNDMDVHRCIFSIINRPFYI